MAKVTFMGIGYECSTAIKGSDYIHLLDNEGNMVAAFDGIVNFSAFTIESGTWTAAESESDCAIAVIGSDGTVRKGTHKCGDILPTLKYSIVLVATSWSADAVTGTYKQLVDVPELSTNDIVILNPTEELDWVYGTLSADITSNGKLTFTTYEVPSVDVNISAYIIRTSATLTA